MTDKLLSAEELTAALRLCDSICARKISAHIAALTRAHDEARAQALEEAAGICEARALQLAGVDVLSPHRIETATQLAIAIRAAKDQP